jgi:gluconate 2-dehydrogenase gamma chain
MSIRRDFRNAAQSEQLADLIEALHTRQMDRRCFLQGLAFMLSIAETMPLSAAANATPIPSRDPWLTLYSVQAHLFPDDPDSPGAVAINATAYLQTALADPVMNPDSREFILSGVGWLNETSQQRHRKVFAELDETAREDVLQYIAGSRAGERWISQLLLYTFEALLADPVYGGNPGGIGWKWLEHQPGFPRPYENGTYHRLLDKQNHDEDE